MPKDTTQEQVNFITGAINVLETSMNVNVIMDKSHLPMLKNIQKTLTESKETKALITDDVVDQLQTSALYGNH